MILVIDAGNTLINFGVFDGQDMMFRYSLPSSPRTTAKKCMEKYDSFVTPDMKIDGAISCSVVPGLNGVISEFAEKELGVTYKEFRNDSDVGIVNAYAAPRQVGVDRLVNALAAKALYGTPVFVVDLGTAITVDVVSPNSEYLGGVIAPGLGISAEALHKKTALLPRAELVIPEDVLGTDTASSIQSGLTYGFACLVNGIIEELRNETGYDDAPVIVTGGHTRILEPLLRNGVTAVDENLTLRGLSIAYERL